MVRYPYVLARVSQAHKEDSFVFEYPAMVKKIAEVLSVPCPICDCSRGRVLALSVALPSDRQFKRVSHSKTFEIAVAKRNIRSEIDKEEFYGPDSGVCLWVRCQGCDDGPRVAEVGDHAWGGVPPPSVSSESQT